MWRTLAIGAVLGVLAQSAVAQDGGKIPWKKDPTAGLREARKKGKPMMLFFTSVG